jgi:hypothetical protein
VIPEEDDAESLDVQSSQVSRRGRPKIPITWSRVMHVTPELSNKVKEHWVATDIMLQKNLMNQSQLEPKADWKMLFRPKEFAQQHEFESLSNWELKPDQLMKYAKLVTKLRADLRKRVLQLAEKEGKDAVEVEA